MVYPVFLVNSAVVIPIIGLALFYYFHDLVTGRLRAEKEALALENQGHLRRAHEQAVDKLERQIADPILWQRALTRWDQSPAGRRLARLRRS